MKFSLSTALFALGWGGLVSIARAAAPSLPRRLRSIVYWLYAQTIELATFVCLAILRLLPLSLIRGRPSANALSDTLPGGPVLLVHGYLNAGFVWAFQKRQLAKEGIGPIYTMNLGYPFHSIETFAKRVAEKARQIAQETGRSDLSLVGHSMGGVVSSHYALNLAPRGSIAQVITIASPLQGTHVAKIGLGYCAREMERGSSFIKKLDSALQSQKEIRFYHIATKTDQLVIPYTSALPNPHPDRQYLIEDLGHASLLFSPRVATKLTQWLRDCQTIYTQIT